MKEYTTEELKAEIKRRETVKPKATFTNVVQVLEDAIGERIWLADHLKDNLDWTQEPREWESTLAMLNIEGEWIVVSKEGLTKAGLEASVPFNPDLIGKVAP